MNEALPAIFGKPSDFVAALNTMPKDHPTDHKFKAGPVPGVCYQCGHIQADTPTDCHCGHDLRWHAEHRVAAAYDQEAGMLTMLEVGDLMEGVPSLTKLDALDIDAELKAEIRAMFPAPL